ncbi:sigma-70 family RNA polymerase sigma factor [Segnochrobactraceae bacterium EtOH-i3]
MGHEVWTELMLAARGGDARAYDRFLKVIAPVLRAAARAGLARAGLPLADAEDVLQEILLAVHLKRGSWDPALPVGPWLRAIARHKLIDALRRRGRRVDLPIEDFAEILPAADSAEPGLARDVERGLMALPAGQREAVRAIAVEGASIGEAALRLGLSEGATRVALHRGLKAIAARFAG